MLILALFVSKSVWAGGFTVSSIGGVTTNNLQVSKFWHTSLKPVFRGTALPGADITITIDGTGYQIVADWFKVLTDRNTFRNQLVQKYTYLYLKSELDKQGFEISHEDMSEKNQIHLVVRRTV